MPKRKGHVGNVGRPDFPSMTVQGVMETKVQSVHPRTRGDVIASLMIEGFGSVPVVDQRNKLIGIVSEHDLLAALDEGKDLGSVTAAEMMTGNPYSIPPATNLSTLVHVLRASDLVRVPVVDDTNRLVGIIARRDVLRAYLAAGSSGKKSARRSGGGKAGKLPRGK
ncbi:MAG: CBS domain-containing protein [Nitrospira sp.]|nr:CBS domain-containing protein [Nitrospira sp.]